MNYAKKGRPKVSTCNICGLIKPMSWDHIPPQGGVSISPMEMHNICDLIRGVDVKKYRLSQNGVKFRTICSDCNSFIGSRYDPTLNDFNRKLGDYIKTQRLYPQTTFIKTQPYALIRAVLAHILAAKQDLHNNKFDEELMTFFKDENNPLPGLNIFYWVYPFDRTTIMRDFFIMSDTSSFDTMTGCSIIKYFPIAFLITEAPSFRGLQRLTDYSSCQAGEFIDLPISLLDVKKFNWPENIEENGIMALTQETENGISARRKKG